MTKKVFFYTQKETVSVQNEDGSSTEQEVVKAGYTLNVERVLMTYPDQQGLAVVLDHNVDKLNPVEYEYKIDPQTKQRVPVKVKKFEITSEPVVIYITEEEEQKALLTVLSEL